MERIDPSTKNQLKYHSEDNHVSLMKIPLVFPLFRKGDLSKKSFGKRQSISASYPYPGGVIFL